MMRRRPIGSTLCPPLAPAVPPAPSSPSAFAPKPHVGA